MSMIWRSAMPLLTTLAALVIIVHCVEEDLENEYRHDLRPRILDTGTSNYDQPWRALADEPGIQQSGQTENLNDGDTSDQNRKRRRPGHKRKRRLQTDSEEVVPREILAYLDEPSRPYYDVNSENIRQVTEVPKRRRKVAQRPIRWADDDVTDMERPLRKAGRRKKRPSVELEWPELSEFREVITDIKEEDVTTESPSEVYTDLNNAPHPHEIIAAKVFGYDRELSKPKISNTNSRRNKGQNEEDQVTGDHLESDKSLSEFSLELDTVQRVQIEPKLKISDTHNHEPEIHEIRPSISNSENTKNNKNDNLKDKSQEKINENDKPGKYPLQLSLKEILKRSNGTSLSEILQQHNVSLSDLLRGKENAVSVLQSQNNFDTNKNFFEENKHLSDKNITIINIKKDQEERKLINSETKNAMEPVTEYITTSENVNIGVEVEPVTTTQPAIASVPKISTRRRYPTLRKKLRMRPTFNTTNTFKGQLSRDLIALNARKYSHYRRNTTKHKEWKDVIPSMVIDNTPHGNNNTTLYETTTIEIIPKETTPIAEFENKNKSNEDLRSNITLNTSKLDDVDMDVTKSTPPDFVTETLTEIPRNVTEKPIGIVTMARPTALSTGLRQQAFDNRLKRKRLKHKNSTTEPPQDDIINHLFGMGNLVSSSEFIARTQEPSTVQENKELTTLDDIFVTTERIVKNNKNSHIITTIKPSRPKTPISTANEEAKVEIEEIFNDAETKTKLSRILAERNMTLSSLIEHRERGSSHIHLADIFHNASREPNPAEPFLSKSLLEPISKETYPLRAILEANLHEQNGKVTTIDPNLMNNVNIPVVMDFGNNVNENAENMGIISLFDNFIKNETQTTISPEFEEKNYTVPDNTLNITSSNETTRESRVLGEIQDDVVSWNEIFAMMGRSRDTDNEEISSIHPYKKITIEEDVDGDGLIVLEDLQRLTASDTYDKLIESPKEEVTGILDKIPSHTKSVTVATASIAGLSMVLFLLTYAAFKWKQQRSNMQKRSFGDERIPTPVFENRKGHKNNSSSRSISPMLQTSNIYTLNTLDSQNGKESPDYMWDSLRKPFQ